MCAHTTHTYMHTCNTHTHTTYTHRRHTHTTHTLKPSIKNESSFHIFSDLPRSDWERMKAENGWHEVDLRDNRYNQIIHMVSAANGAEDFYTLQGHKTRHEGLDSAREVDAVTANVIISLHLFISGVLCVCFSLL